MSKEKGTIRELLVLKLQALYDIENEITKALPKMVKKVSNPDLKEGLELHLKETEDQVARLEKIFDLMEVKPKKEKAEGIRGIVEDGAWVMKQKLSDEAMDAAIIGSARYVEHYEMAGYMSAITWAELLELDEVVELLNETLAEEQEADDKLVEAAEVVNAQVPQI